MARSNSEESQNVAKPTEEIVEKAASQNEGIVIDEATNRRIVRKIDWRLMPIVRTSPSRTTLSPSPR